MLERRGPQHGQQMPDNPKPGQQDTRANIDQETPKPGQPSGQERYAESQGKDKQGKDKQDHQPDRKQSQEQAAQMRQVDPGRTRE